MRYMIRPQRWIARAATCLVSEHFGVEDALQALKQPLADARKAADALEHMPLTGFGPRDRALHKSAFWESVQWKLLDMRRTYVTDHPLGRPRNMSWGEE